MDIVNILGWLIIGLIVGVRQVFSSNSLYILTHLGQTGASDAPRKTSCPSQTPFVKMKF